MKRSAAVALAVAITACSSAIGPQSGFTGVWKGTATIGNLTYTTTTSQNDSTVRGTGIAADTTDTARFNVTGTSSRPSLDLTLTFPDSVVASYSATYVTADSVDGLLAIPGSAFALPLSLKRQ
jgi:hypothetical protein